VCLLHFPTNRAIRRWDAGTTKLLKDGRRHLEVQRLLDDHLEVGTLDTGWDVCLRCNFPSKPAIRKPSSDSASSSLGLRHTQAAEIKNSAYGMGLGVTKQQNCMGSGRDAISRQSLLFCS
jgi:hypothetical protein